MKYTKKFKEDIVRRSDEIGLGNTVDELNRNKKKGVKVPSYQTIGTWRTEKRKEIGKEKDQKITDLKAELRETQISIEDLRKTREDLAEIKKSLSEIREFKENLKNFSVTLRNSLMRGKKKGTRKS